MLWIGFDSTADCTHGQIVIINEFAKVREVMFEYLMVKFITVADREED